MLIVLAAPLVVAAQMAGRADRVAPALPLTTPVYMPHEREGAGAALLSRTWQPHSTHSFRSAGLNLATSLGVATGMDVAREFWPR